MQAVINVSEMTYCVRQERQST